ncbi:UNVERIFIED_CONTAM: hypothetical protein Sindi_2965500 [Sesamum indicum]
MAWAWLVLALFWRRESGKGTPAGRLSGGLRCCVRPMPICIVCAECLPVRKDSGLLWVRFRRGSLRNGYHIQGRQQARKLPNPDTGRIHWRASLVPAAAVIPAPIAWTLGWAGRSASGVHRSSRPFCRRCAPGLNWPGRASGAVTLKKLECSKQAYALYTLAWDNIIGFRSYYVGLRDRTFAKDVFINQERKLGARRRSDTVLVSTINDADQGSADVAFRTPPAPYEKSKSLGSGGSMVARLKLKGIDGRAPPGVEPAA